MGSYYIPSNKLKGENRILYIFTAKSLVYTGIGGMFGLIFYFLFTAFNLQAVGIGILLILALIGYGIGTIKIPTGGTSKLAKNVGGDSVDEIIKNYILYKRNKKLYTYIVPRKNPDYIDNNDLTAPFLGFMDGSKKESKTKEEK
ncbi:MAG: hypothetical protein IKG14_00830 [Clostridia bacterium]|nr:hypothetical protein [Clostridia bacterium]MBR3324580.1 hypothetical protein [Clostridia bacterium]